MFLIPEIYPTGQGRRKEERIDSQVGMAMGRAEARVSGYPNPHRKPWHDAPTRAGWGGSAWTVTIKIIKTMLNLV